MTLLNFLIISLIYFAVLWQKVSVPAEYFAKQAILFSSLGFTLMAGRYTLEYYKRIDFLTKKRLEAEKQKVKKAFQREKILNDAKGRFTNVIAHVFRTPLATIQNNIHILEYKAKTVGLDISKEKDLLLRSTENISYNIERAQFIIKFDSGKIVPEISAFSLQDLLQEVADEINRIESLNRIFRINIDAEKDMIKSDRGLLKKIVLNFASNAAKFSRRDTEVHINCYISAEHAEIYIIDTGYGIPSEQLENIFDIYYHFSSDPKIMGMGLGLAIIKRCADMLGATVRLDSQERQGTSAFIKVPFAQFAQNVSLEDSNRFKDTDHIG
jgi:signal transduction histidine kinase